MTAAKRCSEVHHCCGKRLLCEFSERSPSVWPFSTAAAITGRNSVETVRLLLLFMTGANGLYFPRGRSVHLPPRRLDALHPHLPHPLYIKHSEEWTLLFLGVKRYLVSPCFEPSPPLGIISGLKETIMKRYTVEKTNKAEIRPEEQSEGTLSRHIF